MRESNLSFFGDDEHVAEIDFGGVTKHASSVGEDRSQVHSLQGPIPTGFGMAEYLATFPS